MKRAKLRGLKRNAAVVLGNTGTRRMWRCWSKRPGDPEALVREHAAWALARLKVTPGGCQRAPRALTPADGRA
jgi:epoxyqueuosine reductase